MGDIINVFISVLIDVGRQGGKKRRILQSFDESNG